MNRAAGILLPVTSLPSRYGVGCFDKCAYDFVDFLKGAGQTFWQMLPLGPVSYGDSPYQSFSTFAGNPYFISLEALQEEGVLTEAECDAADFGEDAVDVDYGRLYHARYPLLRKAWERSRIHEDAGFRRFVQENAWWLEDYALFMALKEGFGGRSWQEWPEEIRLRSPEALAHYSGQLRGEIEFQQYLQFKFFRQYAQLHAYAHQCGVRFIGDIPVYVAMDSADVWANPQLFQLDEHCRPVQVAGCPPDGFSAQGQLWGNPLYRWEAHRASGYQWWLSRLAHCFRLYDVTRIDHFRGFDAYYSIPYGAETAVDGHWEKGPGLELFRTAEQQLGVHEVIAEDLGYVTDSVRRMVQRSGFPGMKVLEFAFDARDSGAADDYLPHRYPVNSVVYTGTHDNETLRGWLQSIRPEERRMTRDYLCDHYTPEEALHKPLIALAMRSAAKWCIIPMQDALGLDNRARMNRPSTIGTNWRWRLTREQLNAELMEELYGMARRYGRLNGQDAL
ncbi:MAG: 4-alpha-glucanotransferase [Aristaeellaceae bacterium]